MVLVFFCFLCFLGKFCGVACALAEVHADWRSLLDMKECQVTFSFIWLCCVFCVVWGPFWFAFSCLPPRVVFLCVAFSP